MQFEYLLCIRVNQLVIRQKLCILTQLTNSTLCYVFSRLALLSKYKRRKCLHSYRIIFLSIASIMLHLNRFQVRHPFITAGLNVRFRRVYLIEERWAIQQHVLLVKYYCYVVYIFVLKVSGVKHSFSSLAAACSINYHWLGDRNSAMKASR